MPYEYLFREFDPNDSEDQIRDWLEKVGNEGWEAVGFAAKLHSVGGGLIGGIALPVAQRSGYTFLLKRRKATT
jgi:hypothetical protein